MDLCGYYLPPELLSIVVEYLDFADYCSLYLSKKIPYITKERHIVFIAEKGGKLLRHPHGIKYLIERYKSKELEEIYRKNKFRCKYPGWSMGKIKIYPESNGVEMRDYTKVYNEKTALLICLFLLFVFVVLVSLIGFCFYSTYS